jgi:hypothetical protein
MILLTSNFFHLISIVYMRFFPLFFFFFDFKPPFQIYLLFEFIL